MPVSSSLRKQYQISNGCYYITINACRRIYVCFARPSLIQHAPEGVFMSFQQYVDANQ